MRCKSCETENRKCRKEVAACNREHDEIQQHLKAVFAKVDERIRSRLRRFQFERHEQKSRHNEHDAKREQGVFLFCLETEERKKSNRNEDNCGYI